MPSPETQDTPAPVTLEEFETKAREMIEMVKEVAPVLEKTSAGFRRASNEAQGKLLEQWFNELRKASIEPTREKFDRLARERSTFHYVKRSLRNKILDLLDHKGNKGDASGHAAGTDIETASSAMDSGESVASRRAHRAMDKDFAELRSIDPELAPVKDAGDAPAAQPDKAGKAGKAGKAKTHAEGGIGYSTHTGSPEYRLSAEDAYLHQVWLEEKAHREDVVRGLWGLLLERGKQTPLPATAWTARQFEALVIDARAATSSESNPEAVERLRASAPIQDQPNELNLWAGDAKSGESSNTAAKRLETTGPKLSSERARARNTFRECVYVAAVLAPPEATLTDLDHVTRCLDILDLLDPAPGPVLDAYEAGLLRIGAQAVRRIRGHGQRVDPDLFTSLESAQNFALRTTDRQPGPDAGDGQTLTEVAVDLVDELHRVETTFATAIAPTGVPLTFNCVADDTAHRGQPADRIMEI